MTVTDKLQRVLNAAARVITGTRKSDRGLGHRCKKRFLTFLVTFFYVFNVFFIFQTFFLFLKTLAKVRAASRLTRSSFKITATK